MKLLLFFSLIYTLSSAQPNWVNSDSSKDYIGGVGIVKDVTQKRLAKILARADLLENIKVHISSTTVIKDSTDADSITNIEIRQEAEGYLKDSYMKDSFVDADGNYYVWVVIEREKL